MTKGSSCPAPVETANSTQGDLEVLRSILVALDDTAASSAAQQLAIDLAKQFDCQITGIGILDRAHITSPSAVGIGGMAYKEHRDKVKLEEAKVYLQHLEQGFQQSCEAASTTWKLVEAEGLPHRLIEEESGRHDLLVIGKDTDFHFDFDPSTADTVQRLLQDNPRPLIVCPENAPEDGLVLAAYDGSLPSSRTIHMLALLGNARGRPIHVLAIAEEPKDADRRAHYAAEFLTKHGYEVTPHGVGSRAEAAEIILAEADVLGAKLITMGASGHRPIHDFFLGSTTQRLLHACPCPLFVYQ
jgi:nucleotide-binding universal stress UspA family protein